MADVSTTSADGPLQAWAEGAIRSLFGPGRAGAWQPLAVEASHRRFYRIRWQGADGGERSLVAMTSPPDKENNDQFLLMAELLAAHAIGVPQILGAERGRGWFLMTDLGDTHLADVYRHAGPGAVLPQVLATLHRLQTVSDPRIPPYTEQRLRDELGIYTEWLLGALLEVPSPTALEAVFERLLDAVQGQPVCCVHRDYHCRNLMVGDQGQVGVVDFQDALMGSATYDLASLLRDCYYRFPESEVARWRDAYLAGTELPVDRARFARDLDLTALQRQLKAVGIFSRLHLRDGRASHLPHIVPVLERIGALAAGYPDLTPLAEHVQAILPAARRRLAEPS